MDHTKVAIVGASGYMGEELLRLLWRHPQVELTAVTSRTYAGQPVAEVFPRLADANLCFAAPDAAAIAGEAQVAVLALPHGLAAEYAAPLLQAGVTVIDISADFRLRDAAAYRTYYKADHPAPELLQDAVYGLPERYREQIGQASLIACPGCYPTGILLPTAPLLATGLATPEGIIVSSISGVSGAGRKTELPYLFAECNESVRPYVVVGHRHTPEIEQELAVAAGIDQIQMNFAPHLAPVTRGLHSTVFLLAAKPDLQLTDIGQALETAYTHEPFVRVLPAGQLADTKHVTHTNVCEIGYAYDPRTGRIIISSAIDNLCKGGSGQAVQCLNISRSYVETTGLI